MEDLESESESSNESAAVALGGSATEAPADSSAEAQKLILKERSIHIPYILNGELYEIQTQEGENVTVKCCNCPPDRVYRGSVRSTGNFHMHIKRRHPDLLGKLHDMKVNALLERRDRFMKNRKLSQRALKIVANNNNNNNNITSAGAGASAGVGVGACASASASANNSNPNSNPNSNTNSNTNNNGSIKLESQTASNGDQLGPMHTHKLKIKTAFQRHQQQEAMRKQWKNSPFVIVHNTRQTAGENEPLNFSIKDKYDCETQSEHIESTASSRADPNDEIHQSETDVEVTSVHQQPRDTAAVHGQLHLVKIQQAFNTGAYRSHDHAHYDANPVEEQASYCIPRSISSYGSNLGAMGSSYLQSVAVVKNEHEEDRVIDLSIRNSSVLSSGIGSTTDTHKPPGSIGGSNANATDHGLTWGQLLAHLETSLRDVQREMRTRNQIDIAKFKYLHPGFNFHY